jgi:hypothetical protein
VGSYLATSGYGSETALYGERHSIASVAYWTKQLELVANYLYLPLLGVVATCLVAGAISGRERLRRVLTSPAFMPLAVVVFGYLVLSTTSNQGTAFSLPWIPSLIVLAVAAAAKVRLRSLRLGLAALLVAVCLFDLAGKNGIGGLSEPASANLPVLDEVTVVDGRDLIYASLDKYGYPVDPPPEKLPPLHKRWGGFHRQVVRVFWPFTGARGVKPRVDVATGDWLLSSTRLQLASELEHHARITAKPARLGGGDTAAAYRQKLLEDEANVVLTADPPRVPVTTISRRELEAATRSLGFVPVGRLDVPDGREATVWVRGPGPPGRAPAGSPGQSG